MEDRRAPTVIDEATKSGALVLVPLAPPSGPVVGSDHVAVEVIKATSSRSIQINTAMLGEALVEVVVQLQADHFLDTTPQLTAKYAFLVVRVIAHVILIIRRIRDNSVIGKPKAKGAA